MQIKYYYENAQKAESEVSASVRESGRLIMLGSLAVVAALSQVIDGVNDFGKLIISFAVVGLLYASYTAYIATYAHLAKYSKAKYDLFALAHSQTTSWLIEFSAALEGGDNAAINKLINDMPSSDNPKHGGYVIDDKEFRAAQSKRNKALLFAMLSTFISVIAITATAQ